MNCYDFEPLPTLLEDEVSEAGAGMEPPPLRSPVVQRPQGPPAGSGRAGGAPAPGSGQAAAAAPLAFRMCSCPAAPATSLGLAHCRAPSPHNSKVMVLECGMSRHCCRSRGLMLQSASTCPCRTRSREIYMGRIISRSCQPLLLYSHILLPCIKRPLTLGNKNQKYQTVKSVYLVAMLKTCS